MKKIITLIVVLIVAIVLVGCGDKSVTDLTITASTAEIQVGATATLSVVVEPANATDKTVTYTSSNEAVATVSNVGVVTGVAVGSVTITAMAGDVTKTISLTIVEVSVTGLTLTVENETLLVGGTVQITATVVPTNATNNTVVYATSNASVATVSETGLITAVGVGTATITGTAGSINATVSMTVQPVLATDMTIAIGSAEIAVGAQTTITPTITPANTTNKTVTYSSSDTDVATVSAAGVVTGVADGTSTITATLGTIVRTVAVTVSTVVVTDVQISIGKTELEVEETTTVSAVVLPTNATDKTVVFASSNPLVATVNAAGLVTAVGGGTTTISATAGSVTASVVVNVAIDGLAVGNLQNALEALMESYEDSLTGSIAIYAEKDGVELTTEFAFNYSATSINQLMYTQAGASLASIYVRDNTVYMLRDALKSQEALTPSSATLIRSTYGFTALTSQVTAFYSEAAFYTSLTLEEELEGVYTFALNLATYDGTAFVAAGKDSIHVVVTTVAGEIVEVQVLIDYSDETTGQTSLQFKGLGVPTILFPSDLALYPPA